LSVNSDIFVINFIILNNVSLIVGKITHTEGEMQDNGQKRKTITEPIKFPETGIKIFRVNNL